MASPVSSANSVERVLESCSEGSPRPTYGMPQGRALPARRGLQGKIAAGYVLEPPPCASHQQGEHLGGTQRRCSTARIPRQLSNSPLELEGGEILSDGYRELEHYSRSADLL